MIDLYQFINVFIILLLATTIFYVYRLNTNLKTLQTNKDSLQNHLRMLIKSLADLQDHFHDLHDQSRELLHNLTEQIQPTQIIRDDLEYFVEKAEKQLKVFHQGDSDSSRSKDTLSLETSQQHANEDFDIDQETDQNKTALLRLLRRMK